MTFPEHPADAYLTGDKLTAAHLNVWRKWLQYAVDSDGGKYTPSTPIVIGNSGLSLAGSDRLGLSTRVVTRHQDMIAMSLSGNWEPLPGTEANSWRNTASGGTLWVTLENLPDGATLSSVVVKFRGASGHPDPVDGGGSDLVMPRFELFRITSAGAQESMGTAVDTVTAADAYEATNPHSITLSVISNATIDLATYRYAIEFTAELGTNYVANGNVRAVTTTCIITEQPEF